MTITTGDTTTKVDWGVLDLDGVTDIARGVAAQVARQYRQVTEFDDLLQEAFIDLAENADRVRDYLTDPAKGRSRLYHWLWCDLVDGVKTQAAHAERHLSYELLTHAESAE